MDGKKYNLIISALLHDVGKMVIRAYPGKITHANAGADFLANYITDNSDIIRAVKYHHGKALKGLSADKDDISYIVYEADNIASSTDRRDNDEDNSQLFDAEAPLENIFNVFTGDGAPTVFPLTGLMQNDTLHYPVEKGSVKAVSSEYQKLLQELESNFKRCSPDTMHPNELLQIIEALASFVPSSTATNEVADISLYDHQRLTAAIASCLYDYLWDKGIADYKAYCFGNKAAELRAEKTYILASGDLSGIQNFIYTIPSKGALKSLRGRSFYLEILMENIIDQLLESLNLSRANLLYSGGGNFYCLLPNTQEAKDRLAELKTKVNKWLLNHWGSSLYLSVGWGECSGDDVKVNNDNSLGKVYKAVREMISKDKYSRYSPEDLTLLFDPSSEINKTLDGTRECSVCHNSSVELIKYGEGDTMSCPNCKALRDLGEELLWGDVLAIFSELPPNTSSIEIPSMDNKLYIKVCSLSEVEEKCIDAKRIYVKNKMYTGRLMATRLWMGDYITKNDKGKTLDFQELVNMTGGDSNASGISRLGVLRADVDNLGASFMAGFPGNYNTLGRTAALSRQLSLFFKAYINNLCGGKMPDNQEKFFLFDKKELKGRNLHIVYSGGDDMFIVGAWDDLVELAVDLRRAFSRFTNGKLNFSGGLALFSPASPISEMARQTGEMESYAKENINKDSLALFGWDTEWEKDSIKLTMPRFSWKEFIEDVCGDKLMFLKDNIGYEGNESSSRVKAGKGILYRWLELLRDSHKEINLARFAYVLARMAPDKKSTSYPAYEIIRKKLYEWYQQEKDRKQLETALELIIYKIRQKGDKQ